MIIDEPRLRNKIYVFKDRLDAGKLLASKLENTISLLGEKQVLAIPAGGVPVGYMVAKKLDAHFDIITVRKIQIPWSTEAGFGAISWDGTTILNKPLLSHLNLSRSQVDECIAQTKKIVSERLEKFRRGKPFPKLQDKTVIIVDDGLAAGFTMLVAVETVKKYSPEKIIVAVPTGSADAASLVEPAADLIVCLNLRGGLTFAVADAYENWYDLSDDEVINYINQLTST